MAKASPFDAKQTSPKPLVWLRGEVKTPPFTAAGRREAGLLLRLLQQGEPLEMPQFEPLPTVGWRCGALRIRDADHNWRIMVRVDADAVVILDVYAKKTRKIPDEVIRQCQTRLKRYNEAADARKKQSRK